MSDNKYVSFISDACFMNCIEFLSNKYIDAVSGTNIESFLSQRVDTVKMEFDVKLFNIEESEWLSREVQRQVDKSITNHIGEFHERLIGCIDGFSRVEVGGGYDIKNDTGTIFAEIKNKHNTLTGTHRVSLFKRLEKYAEENPKAIVYFVRIIDTISQDKVWEFSSEGVSYSHDRVKIISGDRFYQLLTGKSTAFKDIQEAIPNALEDYLQTANVKPGTNMGLYGELYNKSKQNNTSLFEEVINSNFKKSKYLGYKED